MEKIYTKETEKQLIWREKMENQNYNVYKNIMSVNPIIDISYIRHILQLSKRQVVSNIEINEVIESNTALVIKATIQINSGNDENKKIFIKTIKSNQSENVYRNQSIQEGNFYKIIKESAISNIPIPLCYDVFVSEKKEEFVIVLEDISQKYIAPDNTIITNENIWFSCVESLAQFHSALWNNELIFKNFEQTEHDFQQDRDCLQSFLKDFEYEFDDKTKIVLKRAMELNIKLIKDTQQRIIDQSNVTICNGDSHIFNFMLPVENGDKLLIVDFQFWGEGIGTGDLAHLTRVNFSDDLKNKIQLPLIEHYHKSLLANGVKGYTWENCLKDYRMSVASMVLIPLWQYAGFGIKYEKWYKDLKGLVFNYEFLKCNEI